MAINGLADPNKQKRYPGVPGVMQPASSLPFPGSYDDPLYSPLFNPVTTPSSHPTGQPPLMPYMPYTVPDPKNVALSAFDQIDPATYYGQLNTGAPERLTDIYAGIDQPNTIDPRVAKYSNKGDGTLVNPTPPPPPELQGSELPEGVVVAPNQPAAVVDTAPPPPPLMRAQPQQAQWGFQDMMDALYMGNSDRRDQMAEYKGQKMVLGPEFGPQLQGRTMGFTEAMKLYKQLNEHQGLYPGHQSYRGPMGMGGNADPNDMGGMNEPNAGMGDSAGPDTW